MLNSLMLLGFSISDALLRANEDEEAVIVQTADTAAFAGFMVIGLIAVIAILLLVDMVRRIRRTRYREQVRAELALEVAEQAAGKPKDIPEPS